MRKFLQTSMTLLLLCQGVALLLALEKPAYGYVDPGSGLLMFQVGGSMIAGAIFCLRNKLRKLIGLSEKEEQNSSSDQPTSFSESQK